MLNIAICDDSPQELALLFDLTQEFAKSRALSAEIREFAHPDALLTACEKQQFHLYILDIVMPMLDGISLGRSIRRVDKEAQILFATTEASLALQSFAANPINFLVKPVDRQAFFDTLELAISKIKLVDATVTVRTSGGICTLPLQKILYCEYINRGVAYTLVDGKTLHSLSERQNFSQQIAPLLHSGEFLQPHISFAVNMRYIEKLTRETVVLRENVAVPISKKQYAAARDAYLDYRLKREGLK